MEDNMPSFITFAIRSARSLKIKYNKQGYSEYRDIKPVKLKHAKNGNVVLVAYDRNKQDWRSFSLDKIGYVKIN